MLKNKSGQAVTSEYVLLFFIVVGMITAMSIYFRRAVQAKIVSSRNLMIKHVAAGTQGNYVGNLYIEYEPYYGDTVAESDVFSDNRYNLGPGGTSGTAEKIFNERRQVSVVSTTAPPKDAN